MVGGRAPELVSLREDHLTPTCEPLATGQHRSARGGVGGQVPMADREFSAQPKLQIVRNVEDGEKPVSQICREHSLSDLLVRRWAEQYRERGVDLS